MDGVFPNLSLDAAEGLVKFGVALLAGWLFCVGASIGSFLNVVVYRLPLGKNLVTPGSSCPVCGHTIRARHNIPVLGWLALGGRCFDCRTPISARYPLVEALVGAAFLVLGWELFLGGSNLGDFSHEPWSRMPWLPLGGAYAMHAVLVTTLIGAALIEFDGRRIPRSLFGPTLILSFVFPLFFPEARPPSLIFIERGPLAALLEGAVGLGGGALFGLLLGVVWRLCSPERMRPPFKPAWCLAAIGAALGWQGLIIAALHGTMLFAIGVILTRRRSRRHLPWPAYLTGCLLVLIPTYRFGTIWGGPPATTAMFTYELAVANTALMIALVAWSTPARYWRRAPRSFPLSHSLAVSPPPEPVLEPQPAEPPAADTSPSESTHDA